MIKGAEMINRHFKKSGMEMHVGRDGKESKTECLWIPTQSFLRTAVEALGFEDKNCTDISRIFTAKENQMVLRVEETPNIKETQQLRE